jgi:hypothetical protein
MIITNLIASPITVDHVVLLVFIILYQLFLVAREPPERLVKELTNINSYLINVCLYEQAIIA